MRGRQVPGTEQLIGQVQSAKKKKRKKKKKKREKNKTKTKKKTNTEKVLKSARIQEMLNLM